MSRRAAGRAFDALERRLAALAAKRPRRALAAAGALGRARHLLSRRWPTAGEVRDLFPDLSPDAAARVARQVAAHEARNRVLAQCLRAAGLAPLRPLVAMPADVAMLRPPLLLGTFHVGAMHTLGPALEALPAPVLAFRHGPLFAGGDRLALQTTEGDEQGRAAAFHRALTHLSGGGCVAMALDVVPGTALAVPCLGRALPLARGPFALARMAGVPLVPLVGRWREGGVEIVLGEALVPEPAGGAASEEALAAAAAGWLERYLRSDPSEVGLGLLRALLAAPLTREVGPP